MGSKTTAGYVLYRVFQTVFAVCMWAVSAAFLSQADELQPPREILKYSEPEHDPAQLADPPAVFMRENTPYYLASWELSEEELPGRMQYGESSVVYEKVGMNAEIPETAEISMEGENGFFTVPLVRSEYGNQRWEDDFSFTLTFHSCQADTYELGGIEISSDPDSDRPELQGYESELLEMLGLPEAHYRITDYAWAGEAYQDEGGALCRDACARGERLVRDCQAVYGGEVVLSPKKVWRTKAVYRLKDGEGQKQPASGPDQKKREDGQNETAELSWMEEAGRVIKRLTLITVRLGLFLLLLFLLRLLARTGRAVWEKWGRKDG